MTRQSVEMITPRALLRSFIHHPSEIAPKPVFAIKALDDGRNLILTRTGGFLPNDVRSFTAHNTAPALCFSIAVARRLRTSVIDMGRESGHSLSQTAFIVSVHPQFQYN